MKKDTILTVVTAMLLGCSVCVWVIQKQNIEKPPQIPWQRMYEDDEIAAKAAKQFYSNLSSHLKGIYIGEFTNKVPINENINVMLTNNVIEEIFADAADARTIAKTNKLHITLVPSVREYTEGEDRVQSECSVQSQLKIADTIVKNNPEIIFDDSIDFKDNPFRRTLEEEDNAHTYGSRYISVTNWWQIVPSLRYRIEGIETKGTEFLVELPQSAEKIAKAAGYQEPARFTFPALVSGHYLRENIFLAYIVKTLAKENMTNAYVILQSYHTNHFPRLCERWNVSCTILN